MKIYDPLRIAWLTRKNQELSKGATEELIEKLREEYYPKAGIKA
jgi:hypothetical protein